MASEKSREEGHRTDDDGDVVLDVYADEERTLGIGGVGGGEQLNAKNKCDDAGDDSPAPTQCLFAFLVSGGFTYIMAVEKMIKSFHRFLRGSCSFARSGSGRMKM